MKLVIFDFDGTLVDSRPLIAEIHRIVFDEFRLPAPPPAQILSLVGKSLDVILTELVGPEAPILEMVRAHDRLLPQLRADPLFAEQPFEGAGRLLHELSTTDGIVLGLATGHRTDTVGPALQALGWRDYFSNIQAADTAPSKPHPAMLLQALAATKVKAEDAIFIGDTVFDMQMAKAAGIRSIGVSWGYHQAERLSEAGACRVVQTIDKLGACIREALET